MKTKLPWILWVILALGLTFNSPASQTDPPSLDQMVAGAQVVVQGKVLAGVAARDDKGRIWTTYTIEVQDRLKGETDRTSSTAAAPARLTIRQLGGTIGKITCRATGVAHFTAGDEVLLFTRDFGAGWQSAFREPQGAMRLYDASAPGPESVTGKIAQPDFKLNFSGKEERLETFKSRIRNLVAQQAAAAGAVESREKQQ